MGFLQNLKIRKIIRGLFILGALPFFSNCTPLGQLFSNSMSFEVSEVSSPSVGTPSSPTEEKTENTNTQADRVVNRTYVAQIIREIFTSNTFALPTLEILLDRWVEFRGSQFGGSCNIYSSFSTKDCNNSFSNTNIGHFVEDNSVRQSYRIQICDNILGYDPATDAALEKVGLLRSSPINATNLIAVYGLFYRDGPPEELVITSLLSLDTSLNASGYSLLDRWRATLTQICETSAWQLF